jgi:hypothetical protein
MPMAGTGSKVRSTKWITPETDRALMLRARGQARVAFWYTDIASLRFGIPAVAVVMIFLLFLQAGIPAFIFSSLVSLAGVVLIARLRGRLAFCRIYKEDLIKQPDEWKNYYEILRLKPNADANDISGGYQRMSHLFQDVLSEETKEIGGTSRGDVTEAFKVLSERPLRTAYDRVFWLRSNARADSVDAAGPREIVASMQSVADVMQNVRGDKSNSWQIPAWGRAAGQVGLVGVLGILPVVVGGTSLAFAKPETTLAVPFRGMAASLAKVSAGTIQFVVDLRSIAASQERSVVATAFQAMRLDAGMVSVAPLPESTNDMAAFPSSQHPLYPEYIETRFSQFRYNVDAYGVVTVDASWATTNAILDSLNELVAKLEE